MTMAQPAPTPSPTGAAPPRAGGNPLTRKLGPLPVWGWALVIGGAGLGYRYLRGSTTVQQIPVGTSDIPSSELNTQSGFLNELSLAIKRIEDQLNPPKGAGSPGAPRPQPFKNVMTSLFGGAWTRLATTTRSAALARWKRGDKVTRDDLYDIFGRRWRSLPTWQRNAILADLQAYQKEQIDLGKWAPISAKPTTS